MSGSLLEYIKVAGSALGPIVGVGAGGVWVYLAARQKAPSEITASQAGLVTALNAQTKTLLAESAKDRRTLKRRLDLQGEQLVRLSADVSECNAKHEKCEESLGDVRAQITQLLADTTITTSVAAYPNGGSNVSD